MVGNVIYTVTSQGCNTAANAVWAIDLNGDAPKATSFALNAGGVWGLGGPVIGNDGTVYVQTGDGPLDPASNKWSNTLLALTPRDLKLKHYFTATGARATREAVKDSDMNTPSPVVFSLKNRDLIVTAGRDGRLYLLDSETLGGDDHRTALYRTPQIATADPASIDRGIWGGISTWEDASGVRWIIVPVWGPLQPDFKAPAANGPASNGSIVAFRVDEQNGKPELTPVWVSRDLSAPVAPVIAGGVVFALSTGELARQVRESNGVLTVDERMKGSSHATLYALDSTTGKELYSSRNLVAGPASLTGLTVTNWRVYFGGLDGTFYAFGLYMEH
jgi:outer membrane protein assembly factor BamB